MAMVKFIVDTTNKLFILKAGITSFDVQVDLYSDAKEHWLLGGVPMGFIFPLRTVAGDPRADLSLIEPFYFMRNGWKMRADEANHTLFISGNIELDAGEVGNLFVPTLGGFMVLALANTTNRGTLLTASGTEDWTTTEKGQIRHRLGLDGSKLVPASVEAFVNLAKAGDAMALTTAERIAMSDFLMQRDASNYEDGAAKVSLAGAVLKLMSRFTLDQIADLARIFKSDGVTPFATQALEKDTSLLPTKTVGKAT